MDEFEEEHPKAGRLGDMLRIARLVSEAPVSAVDPVRHKRQLIADLCRLLGAGYSKGSSGGVDAPLSPRLQQTLARLLAGDSEKQIAMRLAVSPHTVHVYVKRLYRRFDVCSRGELLARFVRV